MVDSSGFGGRDIDVVSVPAQELITYDPETLLSQELEQDDRQSNEEIELPASWLESSSPAQALQNLIGGEIQDLLSAGFGEKLYFNPDDFGVFMRSAYPEEEGMGEYRLLSEIFMPVDEYRTEKGVNQTGLIGYDVQFSPRNSGWQQNTQEEVFHYRINDEIQGEYVRDLLLDGLWKDEDRFMRPQWDSDNGASGYTGSITIDYSLPV